MSKKIFRLGVLALAICSEGALGYSAGQSTEALDASGCNKCHFGGNNPIGSLTGPGRLYSSETGHFDVYVNPTNFKLLPDGGTPPGGGSAGFVVSADQPGTFSVVPGLKGSKVRVVALSDGGTQASQSAPKFDADDGESAVTVVFEFAWTPASATHGVVHLVAWGLSANDDQLVTGDSSSKYLMIPELCVRTSKAVACGVHNCGQADDGCGDFVACGTCVSPDRCPGSGEANVCTCQPKTCAGVGAVCGEISDGCGAMLTCGTCSGKKTCHTAGLGAVCACDPNQIVPEVCNGEDDDCNDLIDDKAPCELGACFDGACRNPDGSLAGAAKGCGCGSGSAAPVLAALGAVLAWGARRRRRLVAR